MNETKRTRGITREQGYYAKLHDPGLVKESIICGCKPLKKNPRFNKEIEHINNRIGKRLVSSANPTKKVFFCFKLNLETKIRFFFDYFNCFVFIVSLFFQPNL